LSDYHPQFFTATVLEWKHLLKPDPYKRIIVDSLAFLVAKGRVKVYAFVIMPNHLHLIWHIQIPHLQSDVQRDFLKYTAQQIKFDLIRHHPQVLEKFRIQAKDRQYQIWERNALSIDLYSQPVFLQKMTYIHQNPVQEKWHLVDDPVEYFYSSARFYENGSNDFPFLSHYTDE
jgi:putative transposase